MLRTELQKILFYQPKNFEKGNACYNQYRTLNGFGENFIFYREYLWSLFVPN